MISQTGLRKILIICMTSYYTVSDDRLVLNVKNVELFLNPGTALAYDVW